MQVRESIKPEREVSESTYDPEEENEDEDETEDVNVNQAEVSTEEHRTLPKMEWSTRLSKSNVLGKNPYLINIRINSFRLIRKFIYRLII